jgi:hypothetical protein
MVRFLISITDVTGAPIDTSLSVQVGMSYADEVSLTPVHDGTGQYHADWNTTSAVAGTYYCVATGTGILNVAAEVSITLKAPHL